MEMSDKLSRRILAIHYLRAIAATMVVLYHIFSYHLVRVEDAPNAQWLKEGVAIFFAISGYVMVSSTAASSPGAGHFLWRRFKRVAPLYWVATFCIFAGAPEPLWRRVLASVAFLPAINPTSGAIDAPILNVGWTLNFEMAFYLLFACSMMLPRRIAFWTLTGGLTLISLSSWLIVSRPIFLAYYGQPFLLDFVAGMLIAHCRVYLPTWCFPMGFVLLWMVGRLTDIHLLSATIPAAVILASALSMERWLPEQRFFVLLGDASYAIYLTHVFVILSILPVAGADNGGAFTLAAALAGSTAVGILVHLYLELPLTNLITWGEARLRRNVDMPQGGTRLLP